MIFITGASGTGKSALVRTLTAQGLRAVDTDAVPELAAWVHRLTGERSEWHPGASPEWHRNNHWVIDRRRLEVLRSEGTQVVAGLAANQAELLDLFDVVVLLQCPSEVFLQRIRARVDNVYGHDPAEQRIILDSYQAMEQQMIALGAIVVDADRPLADVARQIVQLSRSTL